MHMLLVDVVEQPRARRVRRLNPDLTDVKIGGSGAEGAGHLQQERLPVTPGPRYRLRMLSAAPYVQVTWAKSIDLIDRPARCWIQPSRPARPREREGVCPSLKEG